MSEDEPGGASGGPPALLHTSLLYQRLEALGLSGHVRCWFLRRADGSAGALVVDDRSAFLKGIEGHWTFLRGLNPSNPIAQTESSGTLEFSLNFVRG